MTSIPQNTPGKKGVNIPIFGIIVTAVGTILLLNTFDVLEWNVWLDMWRLWPVLIVLVGLKLLFAPVHPLLMLLISGAAVGGAIGFAFALSDGDLFSSDFSSFSYEAPINAAEVLELEISFGAGTLNIEPLDASDSRLIAVEFFDDEDSVEMSSDVVGNTTQIKLNVGSNGISFLGLGGSDREWTVRINPSIPTKLDINGGAGRFVLLLTDTIVTEFEIDLGAADLDVFTPANGGHVRGSIDAGAADITVTVPPGTAARIDNNSGVSSVDIDSSRFPKDDGIHRSPGYETAENRLDLSIDAGASSIVVK